MMMMMMMMMMVMMMVMNADDDDDDDDNDDDDDDDDNDDDDADADDADAGSPDNAVGESAYNGIPVNEHTVNYNTNVRGSENNAAANYCDGITDVASILLLHWRGACP